MTTSIRLGLYSYVELDVYQAHLATHRSQPVGERGPLPGSNRAHFCEICYDHDIIGYSTAFIRWYYWARETLNANSYTGKTAILFGDVCFAYDEGKTPAEVGRLIRKLLITLYFSTPRVSLQDDTYIIYQYIARIFKREEVSEESLRIIRNIPTHWETEDNLNPEAELEVLGTPGKLPRTPETIVDSESDEEEFADDTILTVRGC